LIYSHLAALLDLALLEGDPLAALVNGLQQRQMLLLLDNCEHLIDAVAALSESILRGAPHVHILATSRESLRAEGEYVQRLDSLEYPPMTTTLNREQTLNFSALQLFVERATAAQESFELSDTQLPQAIEICHRLDGIPLALELAAAQVAELGLDGLLSQLQGRLPPLAAGQSGAPPHPARHAGLEFQSARPLRANLPAPFGRVSRRVHPGVSGGRDRRPTNRPRMVFVSITQLVAKSLLAVEVGDEDVFYRLLDTTRRYALEKLDHAAECEETRERHAERCLALMQQAQNDWENTPTLLWIERYARGLEDLRAALDWSLNGVAPGVWEFAWRRRRRPYGRSCHCSRSTVPMCAGR
jgi:predicted ATPase